MRQNLARTSGNPVIWGLVRRCDDGCRFAPVTARPCNPGPVSVGRAGGSRPGSGRMATPAGRAIVPETICRSIIPTLYPCTTDPIYALSPALPVARAAPRGNPQAASPRNSSRFVGFFRFFGGAMTALRARAIYAACGRRELSVRSAQKMTFLSFSVVDTLRGRPYNPPTADEAAPQKAPTRQQALERTKQLALPRFRVSDLPKVENRVLTD